MSRIELVTGLPNWNWSAHARQEIALTGEDLVEQSDFVWRIGHVAVAGFIHYSFTSPPWMWFVLAEDVTIGDLIDFRRLSVRMIPKGTLTAVDANFAIGLKFAKAYGFVDANEDIDYFGRCYKVMRKN
jgi:hypothetical protein